MRTAGQNTNTAGHAEDAARPQAHAAAQTMLDAFASVGAMTFDITLTHIHGEKQAFLKALSLASVCQRMPDLLDHAARQNWNVIVRPLSPPVFLQLDDLDHATCERLQSVSFLSLETSPGSYQA